MWLSDFEEAIAAMKEHCKCSCYSKIEVGVFGDRFIFTPDGIVDFEYIYFRNTKTIYRVYSDTWKNSEHKDLIYKGDE